jgi:UDP-N-acetylmuramoyl-L-alanyl-D-glutamate--2,6-diaminopimelate ligase
MKKLVYSLYHLVFAFIGQLLFGFPSRKLFVVGVTGTKGKSTTIDLLAAIAAANGGKPAVLSTVRRSIPGVDATNTTGNSMPGRLAIARFLRQAVNAGATHAFIEVTSQGVVQHRDRFIDWDAALFLNLAPEHIEAHGSFEAYRSAKVRFFHGMRRSRKRGKFVLVNDDDPSTSFFIDAVKDIHALDLVHFSREWVLEEAATNATNLLLPENRRWIGEWLVPEFNLMNAAAAARFATHCGITWETIIKGFKAFQGTPGRMEFVQRKPFAVVIDYAHTPDSFEKVLATLRESFVGKNDSLICVFGSASGGRDVWKRPVMGRIAAEQCDAAIVTNEDPFDEDPMSIILQIQEGFGDAAARRLPTNQTFAIPDRRQAIRKAFSLAREGDVVVMTGKGTETSIRIDGGRSVPWNERTVAEEELAALGMK